MPFVAAMCFAGEENAIMIQAQGSLSASSTLCEKRQRMGRNDFENMRSKILEPGLQSH